ncbi:MAG: aromatic acid exporter family protein [bacterium]|nr:aromatic acid exporter family protein [bacterium]
MIGRGNRGKKKMSAEIPSLERGVKKQKRRTLPDWKFVRKQLVFAVKIALGTCCAIVVAEELKLDFASSAGIITLLTILSTKWETLRLAASRIVSFGITIFLSWLIFGHMEGTWMTYGIFVLCLTSISCILGWKNTISVNAVIGTHFLSTHQFGMHAILNEFYLVLIGVSVSIVINLFHNNKNRKETIIKDMRDIEMQLKNILLRIADYLMQNEQHSSVWDDIIRLEQHLEESLERACEYQGNTFVSHPEYYIQYIEMRMKQCGVLHNLHYEIKKIRTMPEQAKPMAAYIVYMSDYVKEMNIPAEQLQRLEQTKEYYRMEELPRTREEFEGRAVLYHVMMELEEFLIFKRRFVDNLDEKQKRIYWNKELDRGN